VAALVAVVALEIRPLVARFQVGAGYLSRAVAARSLRNAPPDKYDESVAAVSTDSSGKLR
jgi:hypothetical protein